MALNITLWYALCRRMKVLKSQMYFFHNFIYIVIPKMKGIIEIIISNDYVKFFKTNLEIA